MNQAEELPSCEQIEEIISQIDSNESNTNEILSRNELFISLWETEQNIKANQSNQIKYDNLVDDLNHLHELFLKRNDLMNEIIQNPSFNTTPLAFN